MKRFIALLLIAALWLTLPAATASAQTAASAQTPISESDAAMRANIEIAAAQISGTIVPSGGRFSFNEIVGPRTSAYGYQSAPNGRGARVTGGGVAQVASTLYLALRRLDDIEFTEKKTYGSRFTGDYVSSGSDAILVDYSSGIDFSFINYGDDLVIDLWINANMLYCELSTQTEEDGVFVQWPAMDFSHLPIARASFSIGSDEDLHNNILLAASSINDTVLFSGDLFSFNDSVGPRTARYGYLSAVNGRGVRVTGGGVAQVASVIWLAVRNLDCVAVVEKSTYGSRYNQDYVSSSNDAILTDYADGIDFSFRNTGDAPLTLSTYLSGDMLICEIYQN